MMNIQKMMAQAKGLQDKMKLLQDKMGETMVEGTAGGGAVKIDMTCKGDCKAVTLDPSVVNASEKDMLEDLIKAAINDGKAKGESRMAEETKKMMADLGLPAGMADGKLPF